MSAFNCNYGESEQSIQLKFEHLCKCLFLKEVQKFDPSITYLHSNPNQPGIETEPVFIKSTNEMVGFQSKFFVQNDVDYKQIENSVDKIIQNLNDSQLNVLYLYCNKKINTNSKSYKRICKKLDDNSIRIELICEENIVDLAREYKELGYYFFGWRYINAESLNKVNNLSLDLVGDKVVKNLDIETGAYVRLHFFLQDEIAINNINALITETYSECSKLLKNVFCSEQCSLYLKKLKEAVSKLDKIDKSNLKDSFDWYQRVEEYCSDERKTLISWIRNVELSEEIDEDIQYFYSEVIDLQKNLKIPPFIEKYILSRVCFIEGDPGVGKTHLLTHLVSKLRINDEPLSLFVLGSEFSNDDSVFDQLSSITDSDYKFSDYLIYLNEYGREQNSVVFFIIDAINESDFLNSWKKVGLNLLIREFENKEFLKLIVSFRSDYEQLLVSDEVKSKIDSGFVCQIVHNGLDIDTIESVNKFYNCYGIVFCSLDLIDENYTNPLYLRLLCECLSKDRELTKWSSSPYIGLFEEIKRIKDEDIKSDLKKLGNQLLGDEPLLNLFLNEFNSNLIKKRQRKLSYFDISEFQFFKKDFYISPSIFLRVLTRNGIFVSDLAEKENDKNYGFFYDKLTDYSIASYLFTDFVKVINDYYQLQPLETYLNKEFSDYNSTSRDYLVTPQVFNFIDVLYTDKLSRECNKEMYFALETTLYSIKDNGGRQQYLDEYAKSYKWRSNRSIRPEFFLEFCLENNISSGLIFDVLISCSVKTTNPLNAEFLHSYLFDMTINERDEKWTTYANDNFGSEDNRINQIITSFLKKDNLLQHIDTKRTFLLLVLFSWILTSSNRKLRDETSKAMIAVLKCHLELAEPLLEKFLNVNDPYVIQRLYGIVLGSIIQSTSDNKQEKCSSISLFVYKNIFAKDVVYEDILLRDYARLIIEYTYSFFKSTFPSEIDLEKVRPPYRSHKISSKIKAVDVPEYIGALKIKDSMKISTEGSLYGDFGRYVFESALSNFDCDVLALKNFAMNIIFNEIGYNTALGDYDCSRTISYYPGQKNKNERIGKKYQWIAFYKILALASDHFSLIDRYSSYENRRNYEEAWDPYVRDFDPTLVSKDILKKQPLVDEISRKENCVEFSVKIDPNDKDLPLNLKAITDNLIIQDDKYEWVSLYSIFQKYSGDEEKNKLITCTINGFFIKNTELQQYNKVDKKILLKAIKWTNAFEVPSTYTSYLKEYPWSQSCNDLIEACNSGLEVTGGDQKINSILEKLTYSCCYLLWEEEYDLSKDSVESRYLPNKDLFDKCKLSFSDSNCELINGNNEVVSLSCSGHSPSFNKLVIRKDVLVSYLKANGLSFIFFLKFGETHREKVISEPVYKDYFGVIEYTQEMNKKNHFIFEEAELSSLKED